MALTIEQVLLAEHMHWTIDYVKSMDYLDYLDTRAVLDGRDKGLKALQPKGD